jgi:hypothetical protein
MMLLLGCNLRDAGRFQNNIDQRGTPEELSLDQVKSLVITNKLQNVMRTEEHEARRILRECGIHVPSCEQEIFSEREKIEGMIIAKFTQLSGRRRTLEGERFSRSEIKRSRVVFLKYDVLPRDLWESEVPVPDDAA